MYTISKEQIFHSNIDLWTTHFYGKVQGEDNQLLLAELFNELDKFNYTIKLVSLPLTRNYIPAGTFIKPVHELTGVVCDASGKVIEASFAAYVVYLDETNATTHDVSSRVLIYRKSDGFYIRVF